MKTLSRFLLAASAFLFTLQGASAQDASNQSASGVTDPSTGVANGTVTGIIRYNGRIPRSWIAEPQASPGATKASAPPSATELGAASITPPKPIQLTPDGAILGVVVALLPTGDTKIPDTSPDSEPPVLPVIDQVGSVFWPQVLVVPKGTKVTFRNSDAINHNVHLLSQIQGKNFYLSGDQTREVQFRRSDKIRVTCDLHAWMRGTLVVAPTPYFAITDAEGRFRIPNVPPGEYLVDISHYRFAADPEDYKVTVVPSSETDVEVTAKRSRWKY